MTSTKPDVYAVLKRTDERIARQRGYDPLGDDTIKPFADAVRPLIETSAPARPDPTAAAELQHKDDVIAELRRTVDGHARSCDRLKTDKQRLAEELEQARAELAAARAEANEAKAQFRGASGEVNRLTSELRAGRQQLARAMAVADEEAAKFKARIAELEQAVDRPSAEGAGHRHLYLAAEPGQPIGPCTDPACGKPYPRNQIADLSGEVAPTPPEPWAPLFQRIRGELADWGRGR
ncbi:hypothetical protein ABZ215_13780 [Amycolatopsis sp. NPDC006131]|uniref:hypothetical protein n=1 Tax=Amycolatopsis sp. NPDC006131 TaxID=3156731 RepID=UPI0033A77CCD